jgi:hypothetical protein
MKFYKVNIINDKGHKQFTAGFKSEEAPKVRKHVNTVLFGTNLWIENEEVTEVTEKEYNQINDRYDITEKEKLHITELAKKYPGAIEKSLNIKKR